MTSFNNNSRLAVQAESAIEAFRFVKTGTAEKSVVPATAGTDAIVGVTVDDCGTTAGNAVTIQIANTIKVTAGGAVSAGAFVTAGADGKAVATTTAGDTVRGIALTEATADGQVIEVLLTYFIHA